MVDYSIINRKKLSGVIYYTPFSCAKTPKGTSLEELKSHFSKIKSYIGKSENNNYTTHYLILKELGIKPISVHKIVCTSTKTFNRDTIINAFKDVNYRLRFNNEILKFIENFENTY